MRDTCGEFSRSGWPITTRAAPTPVWARDTRTDGRGRGEATLRIPNSERSSSPGRAHLGSSAPRIPTREDCGMSLILQKAPPDTSEFGDSGSPTRKPCRRPARRRLSLCWQSYRGDCSPSCVACLFSEKRARERKEMDIQHWKKVQWPALKQKAQKEGRAIVLIDESGFEEASSQIMWTAGTIISFTPYRWLGAISVSEV